MPGGQATLFQETRPKQTIGLELSRHPAARVRTEGGRGEPGPHARTSLRAVGLGQADRPGGCRMPELVDQAVFQAGGIAAESLENQPMTEITLDLTMFFDSLTLFLQSLFGALGQVFAELATFFSDIVISFT